MNDSLYFYRFFLKKLRPAKNIIWIIIVSLSLSGFLLAFYASVLPYRYGTAAQIAPIFLSKFAFCACALACYHICYVALVIFRKLGKELNEKFVTTPTTEKALNLSVALYCLGLWLVFSTIAFIVFLFGEFLPPNKTKEIFYSQFDSLLEFYFCALFLMPSTFAINFLEESSRRIAFPPYIFAIIFWSSSSVLTFLMPTTKL